MIQDSEHRLTSLPCKKEYFFFKSILESDQITTSKQSEVV